MSAEEECERLTKDSGAVHGKKKTSFEETSLAVTGGSLAFKLREDSVI